MSEVLLVQPNIGKYDIIAFRLPEALLAISALPFENGYKINILDQRIDKDFKKNLEKEIKKGPMCVGITAMSGKQISYGLEISEFIKDFDKNIPIVWGGPHVSVFPQQTVENKNVDIAVKREGDITFFEVLEAISRKEALKKKKLKMVKGISYKVDGKIITTPDRPLIKNMDLLPRIPYELIDVSKYNPVQIREGRSISLTTSRGCPGKCTFCHNNSFNDCMWRGFSAERTVDTIRYLVDKYNVKNILFHDDNFTANINRSNEIFRGIINENIDINYGLVGARAPDAMRIDLDAAYKSGCRSIDIGVESGDQETLNKIRKGIVVQQVIDANRKLKPYEFVIKFSFVAGLPIEKDCKKSIELALSLSRENKKAYTPFFCYRPYPGTELYYESIKMGFMPPADLEGWGKFEWGSWQDHSPNWYTKEEIQFLRGIEMMSLFGNVNTKFKISRRLFRMLFTLYHPIAKFRFENSFYKFPLEVTLQEMFVEKLALKGLK